MIFPYQGSSVGTFEWALLARSQPSPLAHHSESPVHCSAVFLIPHLVDSCVLNLWSCDQYSFGIQGLSLICVDTGVRALRNFYLGRIWHGRYIFLLFYWWPAWTSMFLGYPGFLALVTKLSCICQNNVFLLCRGLSPFLECFKRRNGNLIDSNAGKWSLP